MAKIALDHVNVMTKRLEDTVRFYEEAFGLRRGFYPSELSKGAWLYDSSGRAVIHTQEITEETYTEFAERINERRSAAGDLPNYASLSGSGTVEHVAFSSDDFAGLLDRLTRLGAVYHVRELPSARVRQIFVSDPNGVLIEVNCREPENER